MIGETKRPGQVSTYLAFVADLVPCFGELLALLTPQEQARSARYLHSSTRNEFVVGRACLRLLLAEHLQTEPHEVVLTEGAHGKLTTGGVEFNLSHSHSLVAIAVSDALPVGIDIEWADREVEVLDVAASVFVPEDLNRLIRTTDIAERRRLFFEMWTAQEAQTKCIGVGLSGLDAMRTKLATLDVQRLMLPDGYYGAVCVEGRANVLLPVTLGRTTIEDHLANR